MSNLIFCAYRNLPLGEIAYPFKEGAELMGKIAMNGKTNDHDLLERLKAWKTLGYKVELEIED